MTENDELNKKVEKLEEELKNIKEELKETKEKLEENSQRDKEWRDELKLMTQKNHKEGMYWNRIQGGGILTFPILIPLLSWYLNKKNDNDKDKIPYN